MPKNPRKPPGPCRHCTEKPANRGRGLCWRCSVTPEILALYPITSKYAPKSRGSSADRTPDGMCPGCLGPHPGGTQQERGAGNDFCPDCRAWLERFYATRHLLDEVPHQPSFAERHSLRPSLAPFDLWFACGKTQSPPAGDETRRRPRRKKK